MTPQAINYLREQNQQDMRYYLNEIDKNNKNVEISAISREIIDKFLTGKFKMLNEINLHLKELEDDFYKKG